ncbi:MAG TPA: hypothetical protein VFA82_07540 [Gaiellaceae bacterium]|nr:hypothetical protein [Gaiellaceae bacterium]
MMVAHSAQAGLLAELESLELREREVSDYRRRLHRRLDSFPNEVAAQEEKRVSGERRELHRRIDALRARLRPELERQAADEPPRSRLGG